MISMGIDEAGRGPFIGPMVIGAVLVDETGRKKLRELGVKDSKALTRKKRDELAEEIKEICLDYAMLKIPAEILNREMENKSLNKIEIERFAKLINLMKPDVVYIDSPEVRTDKFSTKLSSYLSVKTKIIAENKADMKYPEVSAASILAKSERDREMDKISAELGIDLGSGYPGDERAARMVEELLKGNGRKYLRTKWITVKRIEKKRNEEGLKKWIGKK